jgi:hypothetical protein
VAVIAIGLMLIIEASTATYIGAADDAVTSVYQIYICTTLGQNLFLTGLIAGRLWWLNRQIKKSLPATTRLKQGDASQSLAGITYVPKVMINIGLGVPSNCLSYRIECGALVPTVLLLALTLPDRVNPCLLVQIVGIASTLIVVRVGLGVEAQVSQRSPDEENQLEEYVPPTQNVKGGELIFLLRH